MSYAGDLSPTDTFRMLADDADAVLVDVRTRAEWAYVGVPDLSALGKDIVRVEWLTFPDGRPNPTFVEELKAAGVAPDAPVAFLCRSGQRSAGAASAVTAAGFGRAYNVSHGFEGPLDAAGHRGGESGWKASGLPWRQS